MTEQTGAAAAAPDDFDVSAFRALDTSDMTVNHPVTGDPTRWVITWAGPGHAQSKALAERQMRRRLNEERLRENTVANGRRWKAPQRDPDEVRGELVGDIVARIVGWTPVKIDGGIVEFTPDVARQMLLDPAYGRLLEQCIEFLAADRSFTKRSA